MAHLKKRICFGVAAVVLFAVEVAIALFVHDGFVRPYLGDVLVVMLIHCTLRTVFPASSRWLAGYVFVFACFVEFLQFIHILERVGLAHVPLLKIVVGTSFSWVDILCYGAGSLVMGLIDFLIRERAV